MPGIKVPTPPEDLHWWFCDGGWCSWSCLCDPRVQQPHTLLFTACSVGLHRWAAGYLDGPATHLRDTSHSLRHCYLQRLQGGADSHQVRLSKRTGGSCAWDRDNCPPADHPRYGSSLSVGTSARLLSGNEKADRAAKRGAKGVDSSTVTMKIGLADVYAELTKQAWKQWEKEFHPRATAKEWDDTSPPCRAGVFFPGQPTYLARIMHRLHVSVRRCMCVPTKCECGMSVSFHHVMFSCTSCSDHFQPLTGKLRSVGLPLCTKSLAVCDQREGWSLLRAAARLVYTCPLAAYL